MSVVVLWWTLGGCSGGGVEGNAPIVEPAAAPVAPVPSGPTARKAWFGAVHVHTSNSFDAFTNGTVSKPADAYEWATGKAIKGNAAGTMMQIKTPLDFYAVSDHAELMGVFPLMNDPNSPMSKHPMTARVLSDDPNTRMQAFSELLQDLSTKKIDPAFTDPAVSRSVWKDIVATADRYYEPGTFTTFAAFEWTSNPDSRNLHRVVVFRDTKTLPELAFSSFDSEKPEDLWKWMDAQRAAGSTLLAIPHNANASDGLMFSAQDSDGKPLDAEHAKTRNANEPVYEISQIKGTSETHPDLSPNDEFAGFELWDYTLSALSKRPTHREGSYVRQALLDGLRLEREGKGNPFKYGFIGDTDTHNAAASHEEDNYTGKFANELVREDRLNGMKGQPAAQVQQIREFSSAGLAGIWANENTRESLFDAIVRKETFGTSGPRMQVRMFGGFDLAGATRDGDWVALGYDKGVPMGSDLPAAAAGKAPTFVVWALKDPNSGHLDRIQIVKGWIDAEGKAHEAVHDIAWSGERKPGADGRLPPVGDTVDVTKATYTNTIGEPELFAVWTDPAFDATQHAFYYARVLEIPTPRWSTRDAVALGIPIPGGLPATIQERGWSSPIWTKPATL